jgi:DNA-binding response OmpR family regulator
MATGGRCAWRAGRRIVQALQQFGVRRLQAVQVLAGLLQCLLEHPQRVFSREQLLDALGVASDVGYERTIDSHIKSLRAKLRQVAAHAEPIQTHRGLGYSYSPEHA